MYTFTTYMNNSLNKKLTKKLNKKYEYSCVKCEIYTDNLNNYNKHLQTISHLIKHNTCSRCMKIFRDNYHLLRHTNNKNLCVGEPITINVNQTINDNSVTNNTSNTKYIDYHPTYFKKTKFKILNNLKSDSTIPFFDKSNIESFANNILLLLNSSNFNDIKENKITEDLLNTNDLNLIKSKIKKIKNLCNENELLKNIEPPIIDQRRYDHIDNKLRLYPELLTENELDDNKEQFDDYKKSNTEKFNNYLSNLISDALIKNNMNLDEHDKLNIVEYNNKICVKHNDKQLEEFDLDKIVQIIEFKKILLNVIDDLISDHILDLETIDFNNQQIKDNIKNKIQVQFGEILNNFGT